MSSILIIYLILCSQISTKTRFTKLKLTTSSTYEVPKIALLNNKKAIVKKNSFTSPYELYTIDPTDFSSETKLTTLNDDLLKNIDLMKPEVFNFIGGNSETIQGFIFKPHNYVEGKKYPTILMIHGGPEYQFSDSFNYKQNPTILAGNGYAVIMINPHGSTGRGEKFQSAVRNNWGGVPYEDIKAGMDYALEKYSFLDKTKLCAVGASYGGYMINWIEGHDDRFKCLVNHDGIFDQTSMFYYSDVMSFIKSDLCPVNKVDCNPYDTGIKENMYAYSPEKFVKNWKTPMLVFHGGNDYRVFLTEALKTYTALQVKKIESKFIYLTEEPHGITKPENQNKWYEEVLKWIDKYTR